MSIQTLPQAIQHITQSVTQATRDMIAAANEMRAFFGLEPIQWGDSREQLCLADMLADLREATGLAVGSADDLAFAVASFLGTRYQPTTPTQPVTPEPVQPEPQPIVAPTLAGGLNEPSVIDATDLYERLAETHDAQPATVPPVDDERDLEGEEITRRAWQEEQEAEAAAEFAREAGREDAHTTNGHIHEDDVASTVTGESAATATRARPKRKGRGNGRA